MSISRETKIGWVIAAVIGVIIVGVGLIRQNARQQALRGFDASDVTPPSAFVLDASGEWQEMAQHNFCWEEESARFCSMVAWPPKDRIEVATNAGETLQVRFDDVPPALEMALYPDSDDPEPAPLLMESLEPADAEVTWQPNIPDGTYILSATWQESDDIYVTYAAWVMLEDMAD